MGIQDVVADYLIEETAQKLKEEITQPDWVRFVKTGVHNERAPQREDWFYVRMGSILYRAHKWGVLGTESLRTYYGGRRNKGVKREHHYKASGKVIRTCVQELEKAGYLEKTKPRGRKLSSKGFKLLNSMAKIAEKGMQEGKYNSKPKAKKAFDEKRRKEVQDTLKMQDRGHTKTEAKPTKKKGSE